MNHLTATEPEPETKQTLPWTRNEKLVAAAVFAFAVVFIVVLCWLGTRPI